MSKLIVAYKNTKEVKEDPVKALSAALAQKWERRDKKEAKKFIEKYKDQIPQGAGV